jgi:hypothetical protein
VRLISNTMSRTANITSIPAIREFKVALLKFQDEGRSSMEVLQIEIQRVLQWIEQDRPAYWATQTRRAFDLVARTRTELHTCQMRTVAGHRPSCIEEKQAHAAAKRRLQHCQEQIGRVKQWGVKLHQERDEFRGRMSGFNRVIDQRIPEMTALLDRISTTLEEYAEMIVPDDDDGTAATSNSPAAGGETPPRQADQNEPTT